MAAIRFYKPVLYRKDMDAVLQTMVDEKIGPGERRRELERLFASYLGRKNAFALRTYTDAIRISLQSLDLKPDAVIALSVLTPSVYLSVIKLLGYKYILVDADEDYMPSLSALSERSSEFDAIVLYEPLCQVFRSIDELKALNKPVIEDISASFGSSYGDIKPGRTGNIVISATEENSVVSTAGGAVILADDEKIADTIKKHISYYIEIPDLNAALGIVQLNKIDSVLERRSGIYRTFQKSVMKSSAKIFGSNNLTDFTSNGYGFSVIVNNKPDETIAFAQKYQVTARKTFTEAAGSRYQNRYDLYPNAIAPLTRAVSFPIYPFLSSIEIETIQKVLGHLH